MSQGEKCAVRLGLEPGTPRLQGRDIHPHQFEIRARISEVNPHCKAS